MQHAATSPFGYPVLEKCDQLELVLVVTARKAADRPDHPQGTQDLVIQNPASRTLKNLHNIDLSTPVEGYPHGRNPFDTELRRLLRIAPDAVDRILEPAQERSEHDIVGV